MSNNILTKKEQMITPQLKQALENSVMRVVNNHLRISFKGDEYDISHIGVHAGVLVAVTVISGEVCAIAFVPVEDISVSATLKKIIKDENGFDVNAPVIGA